MMLSGSVTRAGAKFICARISLRTSMPLGDLTQGQPLGHNLEYGPLRDDLGLLAALGHALPHRIGDLLDALDEFARLALGFDANAVLAEGEFQASRGEGAGENQFARIVRDVDEPACAWIEGAEPTHVDIPTCIELGERQCGELATAAVDEIELGQTIEQCLRKTYWPRTASCSSRRRQRAHARW
jgi:hypothetical protein